MAEYPVKIIGVVEGRGGDLAKAIHRLTTIQTLPEAEAKAKRIESGNSWTINCMSQASLEEVAKAIQEAGGIIEGYEGDEVVVEIPKTEETEGGLSLDEIAAMLNLPRESDVAPIAITGVEEGRDADLVQALLDETTCPSLEEAKGVVKGIVDGNPVTIDPDSEEIRKAMIQAFKDAGATVEAALQTPIELPAEKPDEEMALKIERIVEETARDAKDEAVQAVVVYVREHPDEFRGESGAEAAVEYVRNHPDEFRGESGVEAAKEAAVAYIREHPDSFKGKPGDPGSRGLRGIMWPGLVFGLIAVAISILAATAWRPKVDSTTAANAIAEAQRSAISAIETAQGNAVLAIESATPKSSEKVVRGSEDTDTSSEKAKELPGAGEKSNEKTEAEKLYEQMMKDLQ